VEQLFGAPNAAARGAGDPLSAVTIPILFGEIWSRPGLSLPERSMITVAALTVLGRTDELKLHVAGAKRLGIGRAALEEVAIQMGFYGGIPVARGALNAIKQVFDADPPAVSPDPASP
jgi:4-carboxymuconolactone decarboxylase